MSDDIQTKPTEDVTEETTTQQPDQPEEKEQTEGSALRNELHKALAENKKLKEEQEKRAQQEEAERQKKLEEEGKWKELLEAREKQLQEERKRIANLELKSRLQAEGVQPDMLALATNALATQLILNENGEITNIDDIIADTKTQSPSLFSDPNKVKTVPATGSQPNQKGKLTLEDIKNMPVNERPKNWTQLVA